MLRKLQKQKSNAGFTIIEVMIVLAIAGLILLIVFLAVPALQRNSRNTQRKNDISAILSGISEFESNNSGVLPTKATYANGTVTLGCAAGSCTTADVKVGYFTGGIGTGSGQVNVLSAYAATGPFSAASDDRTVIIPAAACSGGQTQAGSARQVAAVYEVETGSGTYSGVCQES